MWRNRANADTGAKPYIMSIVAKLYIGEIVYSGIKPMFVFVVRLGKLERYLHVDLAR